jgi:putative FmdB family regulatory protein
MPIYEYRCASCGAQDDVMQKMSDAPLTKCPACGKETYAKQLSAAGFQLKGNGYYVTDFKNKPETKSATSACATCPSASPSESKAA